jgi:hypothetical protein
MPATNLTITMAPMVTSDTLGVAGQNYQLKVQITDNSPTNITSPQTLTFSGNLKGTLTTTGASVMNSFTGLTTQTLTFFQNNKTEDIFTITMDGFVSPGSGGTISTKGAIGADVTVVNKEVGGGGGNPHDTPEPSTLALGGLGMMFTGLMAWRRRNRNAALLG